MSGKKDKSKQVKNPPLDEAKPEIENLESEQVSSSNPLLRRYQRYRVYREGVLDRRKTKGWLFDWMWTIIEVVVIVFFIRTTLLEAFRIPTGSMEKTLLVGDFLLVNKFIYGIRTPDWVGIPFTEFGFSVPYARIPGIRDPEPGDILVFRYPRDQRINYIKRCVAMGGQTIEIKNKQVYVDGEMVPLPDDGQFTDSQIMPEGYNMRQIFPRGAGNKDNYGPVTVPEGHYFMMGDNRDNSADSRFWGFLDKRLVLGEALIIYFSWDKYAPLYRFWEKIRFTRIGQIIR